MAPSYKLLYFNFTARGEPIRMLLSYGGIPFEDVRFEMADWPKLKPTTPLGQVPVLEIDGKKLIQTGPICRYLANKVGLAGKTPEENLEIETALEISGDLMKAAYEYKFEPDESRKQKLQEKLNGSLQVSLGALEESAKKNGGYLAVNRLSSADIAFLSAYEDLRNILDGKDVLADYPNLQKVKNNTLAVNGIKEWIEKRPVIPVYVFDLKNEL